MSKKIQRNELIVISEWPEEPITFEEFCQISGVPAEVVEELMGFGIIEPVASSQKRKPATALQFHYKQLQRLQTALRLQHDLELNAAGIALVLDLLEEIETLRKRVEFLEKYF